ncbi:hypothetical protein E4T56_gene17571 [Termitomyces sp. T112]|nr:hypothetical protein E4T56_gene17571 [Termitomyces sp. T112]
MTQPENNKPPSKKLIGGRVRVKSDRATDAARLFDAGVLAPIYVEHRDDGAVSFWFGNDPRQGMAVGAQIIVGQGIKVFRIVEGLLAAPGSIDIVIDQLVDQFFDDLITLSASEAVENIRQRSSALFIPYISIVRISP